jgi:hypothetical protein
MSMRWNCLSTAATNRPLAHPQDATWVWKATVEWCWQGKTEELGGKPVPVTLCPQIPYELTRARNLAFAVRGRRLTAWVMPQSCVILLPVENICSRAFRFCLSPHRRSDYIHGVLNSIRKISVAFRFGSKCLFVLKINRPDSPSQFQLLCLPLFVFKLSPYKQKLLFLS